MDKEMEEKIKNKLDNMGGKELEALASLKDIFLNVMAESDPVANMLKAHSDMGKVLHDGIMDKILEMEDSKEKNAKAEALANVIYQFINILKDFKKEEL